MINHCRHGKALNITYSECVCSLGYPACKEHALCFVLSSVASLILQYFCSLSCKWHKFWRNIIEYKIFDMIFSTNLSETFCILRIIQQDIINVLKFSCKLPIMLVRLQRNLNFRDRFSKNTQVSNFINVSPVGAKLFQADGQMDRQTWRS